MTVSTLILYIPALVHSVVVLSSEFEALKHLLQFAASVLRTWLVAEIGAVGLD